MAPSCKACSKGGDRPHLQKGGPVAAGVHLYQVVLVLGPFCQQTCPAPHLADSAAPPYPHCTAHLT